jgi:hypothetical protein
MTHKEKFQDKGDGFLYANAGGISDVTLLSVATAYKTGVSRKYRTLPARQIKDTFGGAARVGASVKYDGEGVFIHFDEKTGLVAFNAPSGRTRIGLPCLKAAEKKLRAAGVKRLLAAGEIYLKSETEGKRSRVGDVIHTTINGTKEEREKLGLAAYDLIMLDGKDRREDQKNFEENWDTIGGLFGTETKELCHRAEGEFMAGQEVEAYFQKVSGPRGLEGIVVRYPKADGILKIKPSLTIDCVVAGYVEGEFEGQYGVLSLLCGLTAPDGKTIQILARAGSGFGDDLRDALLKRLSPLKTDAPLRMSDSDGRPIVFVQPSMVVELEGESLQETNLEGKPSTSQTLCWKDGKWEFKGLNPCPRLSHATLATIREDKTWNDGGTRMEQALSPKGIEAITTGAPQENKPGKVTIREVYTKPGKEGTAVRKILVIERNSPDFHRFTIHWTDYSPGRKDLFKNELVCADSVSRMEDLVQGYREEASKRGWTEVPAA